MFRSAWRLIPSFLLACLALAGCGADSAGGHGCTGRYCSVNSVEPALHHVYATQFRRLEKGLSDMAHVVKIEAVQCTRAAGPRRYLCHLRWADGSKSVTFPVRIASDFDAMSYPPLLKIAAPQS